MFDGGVTEENFDFYRRSGGNIISISDNESLLSTETELADWEVAVIRRNGDRYTADANCNGAFMKKELSEYIGPAIRKIVDEHWGPGKTATLQMDNAGGHGSKEVITEYETLLKTEFDIDVLWQPPNSPESNALDLGVWMSLQSDVAKLCRDVRRNPEALVHMVFEAWNKFDGLRMLSVFEKIRDVADAVIKAGGDNATVEKKRGVAKLRAEKRRKELVRETMEDDCGTADGEELVVLG